MVKKTTAKEVKVETPVVETNTEFARLLQEYKRQSPKKFELKKEELEAKLKANK
jgi:hypothetical protein